MNTLIIQVPVTTDDIGRTGFSAQANIAAAVQRVVGDNCEVSATHRYIYTTSNHWTHRKGRLPYRVRFLMWWLERYPKLVRMVCPSFTFTLKLHE